METITLNTKAKMPMIGLGTYLNPGKEVKEAVKAALSLGYHHIDTAAVYNNEKEIGEVLQEFFKSNSIKREELFITSKLDCKDHGYKEALSAYNQSLSNLQISYLDLYLIHWPGVERLSPNDEQNASLRKESWKALEELYQSGRVKAIGVSNYEIKHLKELLEDCKVKPAVNQVECHPLCYPSELIKFCKDNDIVFESYSPLGTGKLLNDPKVLNIAEKHKKKASQVLIRWAFQHNLPTVPKSKTPERIRDNINIFDFQLEQEDMETLNSMNQNRHFCWNPEKVK
ncbi:glyoxal reductase-like [Zophobas morio]|jgi:diketogulonate reductase-like aldo/keto reductase|uniref:glyoxal reductase-like n=1 Tax=Zophobas morio TaxID=2755281 RepID=UPI0030828A95